MVKKINGHKVGLVGYLTPNTKFISNSEELVFTDEVSALKKEVASLKSKGVNTIIAIGHSGYERDMEIARAVPDIDVIVGGHSHSFLYSPTSSHPNPSTESIRGPYPTLVNHTSSSPTLVVQAYAFTKYLGHVQLEFNADGHLEGWTGAPILLDSNYEKAAVIEEALEPWRQQLTAFTTKVVGSAAKALLLLPGQESPLGNWVADAMVGAWQGKTVPGGGAINLALINSGTIRASFDSGDITLEDLMTAFPWQNTMDVVSLLGKHLRLVLEHSVATMDRAGHGGTREFPQVSGVLATFDLRRPPGSRLTRLKVRGDDGAFSDLEEEREYNIVTPTYLADGGHGFMFNKWRTREKLIGSLDMEVLQGVLARDSPITARVEGRIELISDNIITAQAIQSVPMDVLLFVAYLILVCV